MESHTYTVKINMKKYIIIILLLRSGNLLFGQQDSLHISNLYALISYPDPLITDTIVGQSGTETFTLSICFSIDNPDSTSAIFFKVGNSPDNFIIRYKELKVIKHKSFINCIHELPGDLEVRRFYGVSSKYDLVLNRADLNNLQYITMYCKHRNNNYSEKVYYKIK